MLKTLRETSAFVRLLKKSRGGYCFFEQQLNETYKNSLTRKIVKKIWDRIKTYFGYSFLGKVTEIEDKDSVVILNESRVARWLITSYKKWKLKIISYLNISITYSFKEELKKEFNFFPIRTTSIVAVVAILTNTIFSLLLKKEIGLFGWIMRGLVLFIGLSGLSSQDSWEDIKKTSFFLKRISK